MGLVIKVKRMGLMEKNRGKAAAHARPLPLIRQKQCKREAPLKSSQWSVCEQQGNYDDGDHAMRH